jgi:hypothetical protein
LDVVVTDRLHGMVLALRAGVPALAVDPVEGGAKVTAQAHACGWPAVVGAERLDVRRLEHWWTWCLTSGRSAAREVREEFRGVSGAGVTPGAGDGAAGLLDALETREARAAGGG